MNEMLMALGAIGAGIVVALLVTWVVETGEHRYWRALRKNRPYITED